MSTFNPEKLFLQIHPPTSYSSPIAGRKYTLTHSDETGDFF
nr:staygreen family protein [Alkalibacillus haloalkaliphilus]